MVLIFKWLYRLATLQLNWFHCSANVTFHRQILLMCHIFWNCLFYCDSVIHGVNMKLTRLNQPWRHQSKFMVNPLYHNLNTTPPSPCPHLTLLTHLTGCCRVNHFGHLYVMKSGLPRCQQWHATTAPLFRSIRGQIFQSITQAYKWNRNLHCDSVR